MIEKLRLLNRKAQYEYFDPHNPQLEQVLQYYNGEEWVDVPIINED
jgi:hypothetical protein